METESKNNFVLMRTHLHVCIWVKRASCSVKIVMRGKRRTKTALSREMIIKAAVLGEVWISKYIYIYMHSVSTMDENRKTRRGRKELARKASLQWASRRRGVTWVGVRLGQLSREPLIFQFVSHNNGINCYLKWILDKVRLLIEF